MFILQCTVTPRGIKPQKNIIIGTFSSIIETNAAARGFAFAARNKTFGIAKHDFSPAYHKGYMKGKKYSSCHCELLYTFT